MYNKTILTNERAHMKIDTHEAILKMNKTELESVMATVKLRRNQLHLQDAQSLRMGEKVTFVGRHGVIEKGVVEKIKIKYVLVRTDRGQRWNVPGSHLTPVAKEMA
jgi:starvation-inducible outer membrane lipoprotein|tara:strand:+ start:1063 stop:1380 length:318 start_codon:yes stop_codon:yes gene_type:complete